MYLLKRTSFILIPFLFPFSVIHAKDSESKGKKSSLNPVSLIKKNSKDNPTSVKKNTNSKKDKEKPIDPKPIPPPPHQWPVSLISLSEDHYYSKYHFIMDKSKRTLSLWKKENNQIQLVDFFPADQGKKPGDKHKLGDLKTPEGIYFFQESYTTPNLDFKLYGVRAFTMDYPNFFDQLEKKTGHGIWLHSIPDYESLYKGSRGCLVVRIQVIEKLKNFIQLKTTPIIVQNEVKYLSKTKHKALQKEITDWFFSWKKAWEDKNISEYISYYSDQFKSLGKNKNQWKNYKESLNQKYQFINVSINDFVIYGHKNQLIIRFLQNYQSDQWKDYGEKFLYIQKEVKNPEKEKNLNPLNIQENKKYKIIGEVWSPLSNQKESLEPKSL